MPTSCYTTVRSDGPTNTTPQRHGSLTTKCGGTPTGWEIRREAAGRLPDGRKIHSRRDWPAGVAGLARDRRCCSPGPRRAGYWPHGHDARYERTATGQAPPALAELQPANAAG